MVACLELSHPAGAAMPRERTRKSLSLHFRAAATGREGLGARDRSCCWHIVILTDRAQREARHTARFARRRSNFFVSSITPQLVLAAALRGSPRSTRSAAEPRQSARATSERRLVFARCRHRNARMQFSVERARHPVYLNTKDVI